ncbi:hypothetical protein PVBG_02703 [Plasmodium vivax Brazil I]|uniref:Uncharacterized protein n=1 Tax=Plasmodium vivax (strain Brazil I) TaxID=1033975 RepID=A0A0J9SVK3_PLAV1|nr:hypothetical protein PVBG_02703 [Plasmodium vivax Brazil I]
MGGKSKVKSKRNYYTRRPRKGKKKHNKNTKNSTKKQEKYQKMDIVQEIAAKVVPKVVPKVVQEVAPEIVQEIAVENKCEFVSTAVERVVTVEDALEGQLGADLKAVSDECVVKMDCCSDDLSINELNAVENDEENVLSAVEPHVFTDYSVTSAVDDSEEELESVVVTDFNSPRSKEGGESESDFSEDYVESSTEEGLKVLPNAETEDFVQMVKWMRSKIEDKFTRFKTVFKEGSVENAKSSSDSLKRNSEDQMECVQDLMSFIEHTGTS